MSGTAHRIRLRLFLEGVEVPVIAATVQSAPNGPAAASIQIPPLPEGTRLLPRTLVHLFFLDFYEAQGSFVSVHGSGTAPTTTAALAGSGMVGGATLTSDAQKKEAQEQQLQDASRTVGRSTRVGDPLPTNDSQFKLLFGGEVMGFQWTKNVANRSLVLQCLDWSNYWDYAYQWNNTDLFGPGVKAIFSGGGTSLFTDLLAEEGQEIIKIIQSPSVTYPNLKGLLGGIVHLLESIGGSYFTPKTFAGENMFFSLAELRLHITQMITAFEKDPTSSNLLNASSFGSLFGRTLGGLGQQVSIRQAINALMALIFHETYAIPTPYFIPGTGNNPSGQNRRFVRDDPSIDFIATIADGLGKNIDSITNSIDSGNFSVAVGGLSSVAAQARYSSLLAQLKSMQATSVSTINNIGSDASLKTAKGCYVAASQNFASAQAVVKSGGAFSAASVTSRVRALLLQAKAQLVKAENLFIITAGPMLRAARLNQQIFRPDVWFSAPPRCNVLFPDNYATLSYARTFAIEPTRLLLKTNSEDFGEDELFDSFYVTPRAQTLKGQKPAGISTLFSTDILDHELFTGIIPVFEKMGELNIFAARSGTVAGKKPKVGLAQRSANFLYFKYRFAARQMQVSGKFNPFVAPGFPGLVIDKYIDRATIAETQRLITENGGPTPTTENLIGAHFLANFTEVTHVIDQSQGTTNYSCSYARQPDEGTEFLGAIEADQTVLQRFDQDASRSTVIAASTPPKIQSLGPSLGNIVKVEDVTAAYQSQNIANGRKLPLYNGPKRAGTQQAAIQVPVGITAPAAAYGRDVVSFFKSPTKLITFKAYKVTEEVPRYRRTIVDLPPEEYIRPGWYGDCWHPAIVGQVYEQFFGIGAITDVQQVTDSSGASIGTENETAGQILADAAKATNQGDYLQATAALLALDQNSSIQAAVSFLVQTYSTIKDAGFDPEQFIRSYTWRPVVTLPDLFGSSDLEFAADGTVAVGQEGFHSRAFGDFQDLFGLVSPTITNILGIDKGSVVAQRGDTRKRKQAAVLTYVGVLKLSRGILG